MYDLNENATLQRVKLNIKNNRQNVYIIKHATSDLNGNYKHNLREGQIHWVI